MTLTVLNVAYPFTQITPDPPPRPNTWLNPVSRAQAAKRWTGLDLLSPIENGVRVEDFSMLSAARCVVVSSCDETGSLVAMEAIAAGTPVVAFRVGALPEVVDHGITGYIVDDVAGMAEALRTVDQIDSETCELSRGSVTTSGGPPDNMSRSIIGSRRMRERNA